MERSSPSAETGLPSEFDSQLSSVIYDLSHQVQVGIENMLKMRTEIDQSSAEIMDDMEKCKANVLERKKGLDEEKEHFQKAAYAVLDVLNNAR